MASLRLPTFPVENFVASIFAQSNPFSSILCSYPRISIKTQFQWHHLLKFIHELPLQFPCRTFLEHSAASFLSTECHSLETECWRKDTTLICPCELITLTTQYYRFTGILYLSLQFISVYYTHVLFSLYWWSTYINTCWICEWDCLGRILKTEFHLGTISSLPYPYKCSLTQKKRTLPTQSYLKDWFNPTSPIFLNTPSRVPPANPLNQSVAH